MTGLSKVKKRERVPVRASPMSLSKLTTMINYLQKDTVSNELMCVWFMAVGSMCFYGMCRINAVLQMKRGDIQLGLERVSSTNPSVTVRYGSFTIRDRKTDHDPQGSRIYSLHFLPKDEKAAEALTRGEVVFPSLTRVPEPASSEVDRRLLQHSVWWAGWAQKERNETVLRYLQDDVLDREESQLGDSLAPDVINHTKEMFIDASRHHESSVTSRLASVEGKVNNSVTTSDQVTMTKDCLKTPLREVLAEVAVNGGNDFSRSQGVSEAEIPKTTTALTSEFPEAKSWRDYVTQYWTSDPSRHQYRACVDMLPHEAKMYKSRLSKMKLIAEYIRSNYDNDMNKFEDSFKVIIEGKLSVNKFCTLIRFKRTQTSSQKNVQST
ncbi:hypothetical protein ON010_g4055 [Phytophthora cinnamomi]|nr:hypothetical protein ON010_g4055 [Phytophthora cinnamomi]